MTTSVVRPWGKGGDCPGAGPGAMPGENSIAVFAGDMSDSSRSMMAAGTRCCVGWVEGWCKLGVLWSPDAVGLLEANDIVDLFAYWARYQLLGHCKRSQGLCTGTAAVRTTEMYDPGSSMPSQDRPWATSAMKIVLVDTKFVIDTLV